MEPKMKRKPMILKAIRFEESDLKMADRLGLDVSANCRQGLKDAIQKKQGEAKKV